VGKKFQTKRKRKAERSTEEESQEEEDTIEERAKRNFIKPRIETDEFEFWKKGEGKLLWLLTLSAKPLSEKSVFRLCKF